jgi:hypothetical protein
MNGSVDFRHEGLRTCERVVSFALLASMAMGCTAISDLGRFEEVADAGDDKGGGKGGKNGGTAGDDDSAGSSASMDAGPGANGSGCGNPRTLCLRIRNFTPHLTQLVQTDLVTNADNTLRARAILDPLGAQSQGNADVVLPMAIPESEVPAAGEDSPLHLEIYADQNEDGMYTLDEDHDWNVDLPANGRLVYTHNSDFSSLDPPPRGRGADFTMHFSGMGTHMGVRLEVMVIEVSDGVPSRTVGMYRLAAVREDTFDVVIPGIIDPGNISYLVEFYADTNDNKQYDDPPIDHAWTRSGESNDKGFELSFQHGVEFMPLKFQVPFE